MKAESDSPMLSFNTHTIAILENYTENPVPICPTHIFMYTIKVPYFANYVALSLVTRASFTPR